MRTYLILICFLTGLLSGCAEQTDNPKRSIDITSWYVARTSGRVNDNGKPLNECVKSDKSPAELMDQFRQNQIEYTVKDDGKRPPDMVFIEARGPERSGRFIFFRGSILCMQSKVITGIDVYDPAAYR